ncbi:MAG: PH domain-containing protein [Candidatus Micrarchaeia archaeon]|jgi:hypothetical protein
MTEFIIRPSPKIYYAQLVLILIILIFIIFIIEKIFDINLILWIAGILMIGIIAGISIRIILKYQYVCIKDNMIIKTVGILNIKKVNVSINKIANINTNRSIFERIFKLGTIEIDTAGTNNVEIRLGNLPEKEMAEFLEIVRKKEQEMGK